MEERFNKKKNSNKIPNTAYLINIPTSRDYSRQVLWLMLLFVDVNVAAVAVVVVIVVIAVALVFHCPPVVSDTEAPDR